MYISCCGDEIGLALRYRVQILLMGRERVISAVSCIDLVDGTRKGYLCGIVYRSCCGDEIGLSLRYRV